MTFFSALCKALGIAVPFAAGLASLPHTGAAEGGSVAVTTGLMTTNTVADVFAPGATDLSGSGFSGVNLAYERQIGQSRWDLGLEVQANLHYGNGTYGEVVVPVTLRYTPTAPWFRRLDSYGFGLGLSHATDLPQVEIDSNGESNKTLVYFFVESALAVGEGDDELFFRLHHRSDGFGLFPVDTGSNALAVGLRHRF